MKILLYNIKNDFRVLHLEKILGQSKQNHQRSIISKFSVLRDNGHIFSETNAKLYLKTKSSFYPFGEPFKSFDGKNVIPWERVNDNYCDTNDGSDEPGTSACIDGTFFCTDTQLGVISINSAFVNDGVCDCCDGSDEYKNLISCNNTCRSLLEKQNQKNLEIMEKVTKGHKLYLEYISQLEIELAEEELRRQREEAEKAASQSTEAPDTIEETTVVPEKVSDDQSMEAENEHEDPASSYDSYPDVDATDEPLPKGLRQPIEPEVEQSKPIDYGPGQAFRMLAKTCLTFDSAGHSYRLCPFANASQAALGSTWGAYTGLSLGRWQDWVASDEQKASNDPARYSIMRYSGGVGCFEGPARSVMVHVQCSDENRITSVTEPSRCEYVMNLETIAACFEDPDVVKKRLNLNDFAF